MDEEDAQTAALQEYFDDNRPSGHGASFRAGWDAHREYALFRAQAPSGEVVVAENRRLKEQLRIATDQLQAFSDQGRERYPGEMGTFAHDALIQMSVVE